MIPCPKCGELNGNDRTECFECGASLIDEEPKKRICPRCGSVYVTTSRRCGDCGESLVEYSESVERDIVTPDLIDFQGDRYSAWAQPEHYRNPRRAENAVFIGAVAGIVLTVTVLILVLVLSLTSCESQQQRQRELIDYIENGGTPSITVTVNGVEKQPQ